MKKLYIFIIAFIIPFVNYAQLSLDDIPLAADMSHVFYANNSIEEKLMNTKTWIATTFGDYKSVLQFEDNANGRIIIKGKTKLHENVIKMPFSFNVCTASQYTFTITFDLKGDRFRIKIEDIKFMFGENSGPNATIPIPNEERTLDISMKMAEDNATYELREKREEASELFERLRVGDYKKKDREELVAKYKQLEADICELEKTTPQKIVNSKEKIATEYKSIFYEILLSASKKISESDDF